MHLPKSNLPGLVTMCIYLQGVQVSHCHNLTDLASAFDAARHHRQVTIFDLCGRALEDALTADLLIPSHCIVRNGAIILPPQAMVSASH